MNDVDAVHLPCHFEWLIKQVLVCFTGTKHLLTGTQVQILTPEGLQAQRQHKIRPSDRVLSDLHPVEILDQVAQLSERFKCALLLVP